MSIPGIGGPSVNVAALHRQLTEQSRAQTQSDSGADHANGGPRAAQTLSGRNHRHHTAPEPAPAASKDGPGTMLDQYL